MGDPRDSHDHTPFLASVVETAEALDALRPQALSAATLMSTGAAATLAAEVEAISRTVEYLQIVCAGVLETQRVAATFGVNQARSLVPDPADTPDPEAVAAGTTEVAAQKVHAEFGNTADYLRSRLRISRGEAKRRLNLASALLPSSGTSGQPVPPVLPGLAEETAAGTISSAAATVVADAMEQIRHRADAETAAAVESDLTAIAAHHDRDFLIRTTRRWVLLLNQDGTEPTEEELRRFQGIFPGRKKNGLNHLNIYCTDDQHETLLTVMNAAAGPRVADGSTGADGNAGADGTATAAESDSAIQASHEAASSDVHGGDAAGADAGSGETAGHAADMSPAQRIDGAPVDPGTASRLDRRSRPQRLLGGLVDAAKAALASGGVPAAGGLRPQVMVTIDAVSLLQSLDFGSAVKSLDDLNRLDRAGRNGQEAGSPKSPGSLRSSGTPGPGAFAFTGPVPASTVRRLACDADILPVVLSGAGRILDIGREQRLFPPALRKALHARDGGCAFPGCSIPGPWTEAHHIQYWIRGGPTSTDNGVLLCSHHHHELHKENWSITMRSGIPWFVPPAYVDPDRVPLRNMYFRTGFGGSTAPAAAEQARAS